MKFRVWVFDKDGNPVDSYETWSRSRVKQYNSRILTGIMCPDCPENSMMVWRGRRLVAVVAWEPEDFEEAQKHAAAPWN